MIRASTFKGRTVAVFGLGASGNSTVRALLDGGAIVLAWDDSEAGRNAAAAQGVPIVDLRTADWSRIDSLVLAPGVPLTHPEPHWVVLKARAAGMEIIGDVEIFARERAAHAPDAPFIAITGTNGKSTTTALIAHILTELGFDVQLGGNIGRAILTLEPPHQRSNPLRVHVIEMSSFQIDLTPTLHPTVGVLLNVTPDHIDRHGTIAHYAAVKEQLVAGAEAACVGVDDDFTRDVAERLGPSDHFYPFTTGKGAAIVPRLYAIGTTLFSHEKEGAYAASHPIVSLDGARALRGRHNVQNALAACAALRALQDRLDARSAQLRAKPSSGDDAAPPRQKVWDVAKVSAALLGYPGLAHRMEEIGSLAAPGGARIVFINDSKATNADSTEKALSSWERDIYWILGGKPKEGGIEMLAPYFPRVAKAYLIGAASDEFAATLGSGVAFERCGTLDRAVELATRDAAASCAASAARSGAASRECVVLLSPACASYDQYKNFEQRGDAFRRLVLALPGIAPVGSGAT